MEEGRKEGMEENGGRVAHAGGGVVHDCGGFAHHGVRLDQFIDAVWIHVVCGIFVDVAWDVLPG
jgi:hypothetical protein